MKVTVKTGFALFVISKAIGMTHMGMGYELTKAGIPLKAPNGQLAKFGEGAIDSIDNPCYNELTCQVKGDDYTCYRMSNKLRDELLKGIEEAKIEEMDFTSFKDYDDLESEIVWNVQKVTPWLKEFKHNANWAKFDSIGHYMGASLFSRYRKNVITEEYVKEMKYKYSDVKYEGMSEDDPFDWWVINATNYFHDVWFHHHYRTPYEVRRRAWYFITYLGNPPECELEQDKPKKPKCKKKDTDTPTEEKPKKRTTRRKKTDTETKKEKEI